MDSNSNSRVGSAGQNSPLIGGRVLTRLQESSLLGTTPDPKSMMCYHIPGELTKDGKPIVGGKDIDTSDAAFPAKIYTRKSTPPN
jgi:hypothetical protein